MNAVAGDHPTVAPLRPCVGLEIPPGPAGLEVLLPALAAAMDGTGPAIALLPGSGSAPYRSMIHGAVAPGEPVPADVAVVRRRRDPPAIRPGCCSRLGASGRGAGFAERAGQPGVTGGSPGCPLHHAGGLMVAVRSVTAGTPVAMASLGGAESFTVDAFAERHERPRASEADDRPLATSLVPAMLAVLDAAGARGWTCSPVRRGARRRGGDTPDPRPPPPGRRRAGLRLLRDDRDLRWRGDRRPGAARGQGAGRTRRAAGDQRRAGRPGLPRRPEARAVDDHGGLRRFRTDESGPWVPTGRSPRGRADDVVQVGGASVSLGAVRDVIAAEPGVAEVAVVAVPHERYGATVVAFVVPGPPSQTAHGTPRTPRGRVRHGAGRRRRGTARALRTAPCGAPAPRPADAGLRQARPTTFASRPWWAGRPAWGRLPSLTGRRPAGGPRDHGA